MPSRPPKLPRHVRTHFINRLKERYDIELTVKEHRALEKRRTGFFLHRGSVSRAWYLEKINEQWVYCLYQRNLGYTTVLKAEQLWHSHPCLKLPPYHVDSKFAEAWLVARADQKNYQTRKVKAEKSAENKRYKAEQASINASCQ